MDCLKVLKPECIFDFSSERSLDSERSPLVVDIGIVPREQN